MHLQTSTLEETLEAKLLIPRIFFISHYVFLLQIKKKKPSVQTSACQPKNSENFFLLSHPLLMNLKLLAKRGGGMGVLQLFAAISAQRGAHIQLLQAGTVGLRAVQ